MLAIVCCMAIGLLILGKTGGNQVHWFNITANGFQCPKIGTPEYQYNDSYNGPYPPYHQPCWVRAEILEIVNHCNLTVGVEVGVQRGIFAQNSLTIWSNAKVYHLVDMWHHQSTNYNDTANVDDTKQELVLTEAHWRMSAFINRTTVVFHRNTSINVALDFPDASVDFVYLDARHDYCGVSEDLHAWYPKLRVGGIMAGQCRVTRSSPANASPTPLLLSVFPPYRPRYPP